MCHSSFFLAKRKTLLLRKKAPLQLDVELGIPKQSQVNKMALRSVGWGKSIVSHVQNENLKSLLLLGKLPKVQSPGSLLTKPEGPSPQAPLVKTPPAPVAPPQVSHSSSHVTNLAQLGSSSLVPALMTLKGQMMQDLEEHIQKLLNLNPSRREAIAAYLDRLAGQAAAPSASAGIGDAAGGLRRWIEGVKTPAQNSALRAYFEEVALIYLSQAILLKAWSDAGLRRWTEADAGKLNWSLSTSLKPLIPLDREGWQVTKPNLYSWYTPKPAIQHQVWLTLEQTQMSESGPSLLFSIAGPARQARPEANIPHGYDQRFFKSLWTATLGLNPDLCSNDCGNIKRNRFAFSPTLRDGTMVRTGPSNLSWAGMEACPFQLMIAELMQLWWGPQAPPLWAIGSGLEAHTRDQLSLGLNSPKPSLLSRISEMEACDVSFVLEERATRSQARNAEGQRFREQLDALPYFKKLKSPATSLGDLQACVTLSKLRPGGYLWWGREEPLSSQDGSEVLSFLLDRSRLVCEWDFSHLEHSLPVSLPLFPKHLYLLARETRVEERLGHRPLRVSLSGQIRSHIELPLMLDDALSSLEHQPQPRGQWNVHIQTSPTPQKDWSERWPDPASQGTLKALEKLRVISEALATVCTVRSIPAKFNATHPMTQGIWLQSRTVDLRRELVARPLSEISGETEDSTLGFAVLVPHSSWTQPLISYLTSSTVRSWLDHHAERKGEHWILNEQVLRWIPIPRALLKVLQMAAQNETPAMSAEWTQVVNDSAVDVKKAKALISLITHQLGQHNDEASQDLRAAIFVKTVQTLEVFHQTKQKLLDIVDPQGRIQWGLLLKVLPQAELSSLSAHPRVQISGNLPPHLPISRIERVKTPSAGVLLATELGFFIHLACDGTTVLDMLWEQLSQVQHPTWSELLQSIKLPRRVEFAQSTANEVLKSHAETCAHLDALTELLSACSIF
jgi:hypothetical protein